MSKNKLFTLIHTISFLVTLPLRGDYFDLSEQLFNTISASDLIQLQCKICTVLPVEDVSNELKYRTYGYRDKVEIPQISVLHESGHKCIIMFENPFKNTDEKHYYVCESELDLNILADRGRKNYLYPDGSVTEMWVPENLTMFLVKNADMYSFLPRGYFKMQPSGWTFYSNKNAKIDKKALG